MANVSTPQTSNASSSSPLSSPDLIFEDLITVSNVLSEPETDQEAIPKTTTQDMPAEHDIENESQIITADIVNTPATVASSSPSTIPNSSESLLQQKIVSLTKIVPKQTSTTTTAKISASVKGSNSGQVVIIQGPSGPVPIRIAGSTTTVTKTVTGGQSTTMASISMANAKTTATSPKDSPTGNKPVTIQVLKMADGSLVPIKNNKTLNLTNLSNISNLPVIMKTTNGPKSVVGAQTKLTSGAPILKSLTLAEAQKAGFIKPKPSSDSPGLTKLQKILPSSSKTTTATATESTSSTSSTQSNVKIHSTSSKEITIKSEADGTTKQIVVPQHMVKLHSSGGPVQAIQIPGKPGVQYVRVLSSKSAGSGGKVVTAIKKEASPTKTPFTGGQQRILMSSSGKPSFSIANSTKESILTTKKGNTLISTVPTLRKIQDPPATTKLVTSYSNAGEKPNLQHPKQLLQIKKIEPASMNNNNSESKLYTLHAANKNMQNKRNSLPSSTLQVIRKIEPRSMMTATAADPLALKTKTAYSMNTPTEFTKEELSMMFARRSPTPEALRRKHCNCTKSQCLKLYCDCFANGEFCQDCNCKECYNNLEYEDERQKAIKICLERNPNAFKPKITKAKDQSDLRLHNKGCNCKRSGCLKNYCECYEAKIACSSNCKCFGCRNVEDRSERDMFDDSQPQPSVTERVRPPKRTHEETLDRPTPSSTSTALRLQDGQLPNKQPYNFITQDVVDATIQCMIAQADECKKSRMSDKDAERMVIEELGRCLVEIIDFSIRNMDN